MKKLPSELNLASLKKDSLTEAKTDQKVKFLLSNVAYQATVHKIGVLNRLNNLLHAITKNFMEFILFSFSLVTAFLFLSLL